MGSAPLKLPVRDWQPAPTPAARPDTRLALALVLSIFGCLALFTVGVWVGGQIAERGQLGQVAGMVVRGPVIDSLLDSSRAVLKRWERAPRRPQKRATMPSGASNPPAAPTVDPLHQPHPTP